MVSNSRTPAGAHQLRPIGEPRLLQVRSNQHGLPVSVIERDRQYRITRIVDIWRIDDEWWRIPISRLYYQILLDSGHTRTIYHDLVEHCWYEQSY